MPSPGYDRNMSVTPGRGYTAAGRGLGHVRGGRIRLRRRGADVDHRLSQLQADQGGDLDYSTVDILFRTDDVGRKFKTFSQELRLQGNAFNDRLDWLVGGYFANEDLKVTDDFASAASTAVSQPAGSSSPGGLLALYSPATRPARRLGVAFHRPAPFRPGVAAGLPGVRESRGLDDLGFDQDTYKQNSRNWALFTHNIFHVTRRSMLTVGLRYTNERKKFDATFGNNNTVCTPTRRCCCLSLGQPGVSAATVQAILGL